MIGKDKSDTCFHWSNHGNLRQLATSFTVMANTPAHGSNTFAGTYKVRLFLSLIVDDHSSQLSSPHKMVSFPLHPNDSAVSSEDHKRLDLDPKRLLATCGYELHSTAIDGDVLLVLEHGRIITVRSDVLAHSSPVFKDMLGSNFSEGQALRSVTNPKVIALEDDDLESMAILCILLHKDLTTVHLNASDELVKTADPTRIFQVAVLADKYALVEHLENNMGLNLLTPFARSHQVRRLDLLQALHLVAAAYLLQQAELFSLFSRRLTIDYGDHSTLLDSTGLFEHIPASSIRK